MRPPKRGTASVGPARPRMSQHRKTAQREAVYRHGTIVASYLHCDFPSSPSATAALFKSFRCCLASSKCSTCRCAGSKALP